MTPFQAVQEFFDTHLQPLSSGRFLVGVSGGVDSMVLLRSLLEHREALGYGLVVVHVNYRLHENADDAEKLVREWCEENGIPYVGVAMLEPGDISKDRQGLEGALRRYRYRMFDRLVNRCDLDGVFLGHHQDDQVETVLLNIGRGSGLSGLSGMSPTSKHGSMSLYRPFLGLEKQELEETARGLDLPFVEDPTNESEEFARNKIRNNILPQWSEVQPDPTGAIVRLSDLARQEKEFWTQYLEENVQYWAWPSEIQIERNRFLDLPEAAQNRFLHSVPRTLKGDVSGWSRKNIELLRELFSAHSGRRLDLPGSLRAVVEYDRVCVYELPVVKEEDFSLEFREAPFERTVPDLGDVRLGSSTNDQNWPFVSHVGECPDESIRVRTWSSGDVLKRGGETISVKELFHENRVPRRARRLWPVFESEGHVLGLPGLGISDDVKHNDSNKTIGFDPVHPSFHQMRKRTSRGTGS